MADQQKIRAGREAEQHLDALEFYLLEERQKCLELMAKIFEKGDPTDKERIGLLGARIAVIAGVLNDIKARIRDGSAESQLAQYKDSDS